MSNIEDLINKIQTQDFTAAQPMFAELMATKLQDALDQQKMKVASQVFGNNEEENDEELEDVSDEEIDEILDEPDEE